MISNLESQLSEQTRLDRLPEYVEGGDPCRALRSPATRRWEPHVARSVVQQACAQRDSPGVAGTSGPPR